VIIIEAKTQVLELRFLTYNKRSDC